MATKPASLPEFASGGAAAVTAPTAAKKLLGWVVGEKPPAQYLNWWQELVYNWTQYLDDLENQGFTWTIAHTFNALATFAAGISTATLQATTARSSATAGSGQSVAEGVFYKESAPVALGRINDGVIVWSIGVREVIKNVTGSYVIAVAGAANAIIGIGNVINQGGYVATSDSAEAGWAPTTAYVRGKIVTNDGGKRYWCITNGTSAGAGGPTGTAADITDGTVHWKYAGTVSLQSIYFATYNDAGGSIDAEIGFVVYGF